jgi:hypothetical protein
MYRKLVGKLISVVNIKLNVNFSVSIVSLFLTNPQLPHLNVEKQIFMYLKGIID